MYIFQINQWKKERNYEYDIDFLYRIMYHKFMIKTLPITKAREDLPTLVVSASKKWSEYEITVNGMPMAVLISKAQYDSWKETDEILSNPQLVRAIKEGEEDIKKARMYDWEEVKKELNIDVHDKNNRKSKKRTKTNL